MSTIVPLSLTGGGRMVRPAVLLVPGCLALLAVSALSLMIGPRFIGLTIVIDALLAFDGNDPAHIILWDARLPRTLLGLVSGAALGTSGALIQAMTRNSLADPGILGVNAGAAFFMTIAFAVIGLRTIDVYIWTALMGAVITTLAVYALGATHRDGAAPVRLVLSGFAFSAVLGGIGSSVALLNPQAFDAMRTWSVGSIAGRDLHVVTTIAPFVAVGLIIALAAAAL